MKNTKMPPLRGWVKLPRMLQPLLEGRNCRLHALVNHLLWEAPVEGGEFGISVRQLAKHTGIHRDTVRVLLLELRDIHILNKCDLQADGCTVLFAPQFTVKGSGLGAASSGTAVGQGWYTGRPEVVQQQATPTSLYNIIEKKEEKEKDFYPSSPFPSSSYNLEDMKQLFRARE